METQEILKKVKTGEISVEEAELFFRRQPFEEMGYAKLDMHRKMRSGFVMERLFEAGARDVHYMPVYMKKNRPAYLLNVICTKADIETLEQIIFEETTTIGIRRIQMESTGLKRSVRKIKTSLGEARVKVCELESGKRIYPEYASVVELCEKHRLAYQDAYHIIKKECEAAEGIRDGELVELNRFELPLSS